VIVTSNGNRYMNWQTRICYKSFLAQAAVPGSQLKGTPGYTSVACVCRGSDAFRERTVTRLATNRRRAAWESGA
jgi:hypothetical protein